MEEVIVETSSDDSSDSLDFWKDWDLKNLTEAEYLTKVLGPKYLPMKMVIPLTITYVIIFVTGIFGNIATCTVIIKNSSMQTATNYYLFSLAISDIILLVLDSAICAMLLPYMPDFPLYELSCIIFFFIPMMVILVVYIRMGLKIRNSTKDTLNSVMQGAIHGDSRQIQSRQSVIRMLSAVVIMFFICWAPFHAQRLLYVHGQESDYYPDLNECLYILSGCLYYFSTTVNPILYNLMSMKFRNAFKQTIFCRTRVTSRKSWLARESQLSNNRSNGKPRNSNFSRSVRSTISQAKEMFRITTSRETAGKDGNMNDNVPRKTYTLKKEDSTSKPLLNRTDSVMQEQRNSAYKLKEEKSSSTTSSGL
ncbi:unnamed protein product [Xylocopa violacea]|uniref:G-protein coupled receptors family 1 profile domain-containing protein n=1 Tax=Xylocopa violacea TaxID=135666 RepID=A0ABP1N7J2_XYLVO